MSAAPPPSQKCPGCKAVYKTATMKRGQRFRCVKCKAVVTVGAPAAPSQGPGPAASQGPRAAPRKKSVPPTPITSAGIQRPAKAAPSNQSLFQVASADDDLNLLDESGSTEDLATALLRSAAAQNTVSGAAAPPKASPAAPAAAQQATAAQGRPPAGAAPAPAAPAGAALPPANFTIPGYKVGEAIAKGGMATVYKGVQASLQRNVAIKVLDPDLAANPDGVARFRKEAAVLSALSHNAIVGVIDAGAHQGVVYLVMEYVPGTNLRYLLENVRVPMDKLIGYIEAVLEALVYAHQKGVVHRDVKPENIIISRDQTVKLADFGIAGITADAFGMDLAGLEEGLTKTTVSLGTANYMAPEQRKSARTVGPRADLYSVGVVLYEILTGEVPVGAFDPPSSLNPNVPPVFDNLVMKALKTAPEKRFENATDMLAAVRKVMAQARGDRPPTSAGKARIPDAGGGSDAAAAAIAAAQEAAAAAAKAAAAAQAAAGGAAGGALSGLVGHVPGPDLSNLPPPNPTPSASSGGGRSNQIDPEAAAALAQLKQKKEEEANWQAWQDGQATATEHRAGAEKRVKKATVSAAGGNLKDEVRRQRAKEVKQKDEQFRAKWEAKEALHARPAYEKYLKQAPAVLGVVIGITLMLSLADMHRQIPIIRDIPPLVAVGDWFASLRDTMRSVGP